MFSRTTRCYRAFMKYDADTLAPEEAGDGLPNMRRRTRAILAAMVVSLTAWTAVISLIR